MSKYYESRTGYTWSPGEDDVLRRRLVAAIPLPAIARQHSRTELAILCRIERLFGATKRAMYETAQYRFTQTHIREMDAADIGYQDADAPVSRAEVRAIVAAAVAYALRPYVAVDQMS